MLENPGLSIFTCTCWPYKPLTSGWLPARTDREEKRIGSHEGCICITTGADLRSSLPPPSPTGPPLSLGPGVSHARQPQVRLLASLMPVSRQFTRPLLPPPTLNFAPDQPLYCIGGHPQPAVASRRSRLQTIPRDHSSRPVLAWPGRSVRSLRRVALL